MNIFEEIRYNFRQKENGLIKLILINVLVFVVVEIFYVISRLTQTPGIFEFVYEQLLLPADLVTFLHRPWTLVTYFFGHSYSDLLHILFNMLFLYWFGKLIHEYIGNRRLINIYILGGLVGGVVFILLFNTVPYFKPHAPNTFLIGASGSVFAVVVAAATLLPHYKFHLLLLGPVKITYIAAFFVFASFIGSVESNAGGNLCHLGGALLGYLYINQLRKGNDLGKPINFISNKLKNLGKPRMKVRYGSGRRFENKDKPSQEEIDRILDKISRSGYESLTKAEKQKLFKASEK